MASNAEKGGRVAVIVAHPDDETMWACGLLLKHAELDLTIIALNHRTDPDRAPRFHRALARYGARGDLGALRDGGREDELPEGQVEETILHLLPRATFDLVLTHSPRGEYTEHKFHDEVSDAVRVLFEQGRLQANELWHFAYDDDGARSVPHPAQNASLVLPLTQAQFRDKLAIIQGIYGFGPDAWETVNAPRTEAFRRVRPDPAEPGLPSLLLDPGRVL
ncbi:PIG-L family deacetylase [Mesoterricola sediminis]|uniref:PIG-L family deacetylase n=1 Tax=Mesoterricola sediminis TaxID=2927980 RepID=A0AA48GSR1_9BACT|nr:hypothetical protein [Mesoterricola sediminis]BDU76902.1 hypothetical protein METESE_18600 [Mesoterricola sediminis]